MVLEMINLRLVAQGKWFSCPQMFPPKSQFHIYIKMHVLVLRCKEVSMLERFLPTSTRPQSEGCLILLQHACPV